MACLDWYFFFTDEEWTAWFNAYTNFIVHYAQLAESLQVEMFSAGCELITPTLKEAQWREIIANIRKVYRGMVTYSANWGTKYDSYPTALLGGEVDDIQWIDALDIIGIDAYYPLSQLQDPSLNNLLDAWGKMYSYFTNLSKRWNNKAIIFTELGYRSMNGALIHPGWWNISGSVNVTQQAEAYEAFFMAVADQSWFEGIFWWAWDCNPNAGGERDTGYSPQGKTETLNVLRKYYSQPLIKNK